MDRSLYDMITVNLDLCSYKPFCLVDLAMNDYPKYGTTSKLDIYRLDKLKQAKRSSQSRALRGYG
jgi:hypothetical protein